MDLAVQTRAILGKKVKRLRKQGLVPAELYGRGLQNTHLAVTDKDFNKVFKQAGENTVVNLIINNEIATPPAERGGRNDEEGRVAVLISGVTRHPVNDSVESVDFYQVRLDEKLKTKVPVSFTGESAAVKHQGGILIKAMPEIEVEALPNDIPQSFVVDLSKLAELNQSFYVRDLIVSDKVKILVDKKGVIVTVKPQMTEEEEKALEEKAVPSVETIKVETEEKKAEREAEKTTEKGAEKEVSVTPKPEGKPESSTQTKK